MYLDYLIIPVENRTKTENFHERNLENRVRSSRRMGENKSSTRTNTGKDNQGLLNPTVFHKRKFWIFIGRPSRCPTLVEVFHQCRDTGARHRLSARHYAQYLDGIKETRVERGAIQLRR